MIFFHPSDYYQRLGQINHLINILSGKTKFALLPTELSNGQVVWLQKYNEYPDGFVPGCEYFSQFRLGLASDGGNSTMVHRTLGERTSVSVDMQNHERGTVEFNRFISNVAESLESQRKMFNYLYKAKL